MSLEYEKKKYLVLKEMVNKYKEELLQDREHALNMPIETENGFNIERETILTDIDDKLAILKRHSQEPYFAKLVFEDKDDGESFNGYIGRLSIGEINNSDDNKIVDWRAPISDLYYNGRIGHSSYTANGNNFNVDLKLKRQIDIKNDQVNSIYDFEESISSDEFLKPYLTQSADNRLKNIVATIQEEQNKIIRLPVFKNCIVQGVAGSGKTTVALHRLSYLMYNFKKTIRPEEFLIISPNDIFMSYISSILVDLDADKSNSFSFNTLIKNIIGSDFTILSKHHQYDILTKHKVSVDYLKYKNSPEFATLINQYVQEYINNIFSKPLKIMGQEILEGKEIQSFFKIETNQPIETIIKHGFQKLGLSLQYNQGLQKQISDKLDKEGCELIKKFQIMKKIESGNYSYLKNAYKPTFNIIKMYSDFISNIEN
jgi:DNA helicase IV